MDTRRMFFRALTLAARENDNLVFLTGDLGYNFMEPFAQEFPDRFINCGIAEQNMVGVAAGLALAGKKPVVYSNSIFLLYRAGEQIRSDIVYPKLPVTLVGTGASGFLGHTHNFVAEENSKTLADNMGLYYENVAEIIRDETDLKQAILVDNAPIFLQL